MIRIQLHLTDEQDRRLRALARRDRTTRAELIRRAIDRLVGAEGEDDLTALIGAGGAAGAPHDTAQQHDQLLYGHEELPLPVAAERPFPKRRK